MTRRLISALMLSAATAAPALRADVKLPAIIGDNMALQQGIPVPVWGWADPGEDVTVTICGQTKSIKAGDDKKWSLKLDALKAGGPFEMTVKGKNEITVKNVLVGEVWVCSGQSNMSFALKGANDGEKEIAAAKYPNMRLFTVKAAFSETPMPDCQGKWVECSPETAGGFSAVGYFFGRHLHKELNTPVGLINTSWGGTPAEAWTSLPVLQSEPDFKPILERYAKAKELDTPENFQKRMDAFKKAQEKHKADLAKAKADNLPAEKHPKAPRAPLHALSQQSPAGLYNAMIAPIMPYAIAGATWYQGEGNAGRAQQYRKLLPAMINGWRKDWGQDFSFMIVQLANYQARRPEPADSSWAELREAQTLTALNTPKTGVGLAIDIGEAGDIHPKNKQDAGLRIALQALKITYGKDIPFSGPMFDSSEIAGSAIKVKFKYEFGGLEAKGGELKGLAVAGDDKKFHWATAKIEGNTVTVSSDKVAKPVAVRYAWADNPECNLYNKAGLPAVPFRTDTWPGVTDGKN